MLRFVVASISLLFLLSSAFACPSKKVLTIGVQSIDYAPHYNFIDENGRGYFNSVLKLLEQQTQCQFKVISLPIKRLNLLFNQADSIIDFVYPDNPNWHSQQVPKYYSIALVTALGGTMVQSANKKMSLAEVTTLVAPRGFTPVAWLALKPQYRFSINETASAKAALQMVATNRASAADVEYNVAQELIRKHQLPPLVLADNLPFTPTTFHLASNTQPELITYFNQKLAELSPQLQKLKHQHKIVEVKP